MHNRTMQKRKGECNTAKKGPRENMTTPDNGIQTTINMAQQNTKEQHKGKQHLRECASITKQFNTN